MRLFSRIKRGGGRPLKKKTISRLLVLTALTVLLLLPQTGSVSPANRNILLTFDDGPNPRYTPEILAILRQNDIRAIFFVVGEQAEANPELLRQILSEGHTLGNHTYDHAGIHRMTAHQLQSQVLQTDKAIHSITGVVPTYFRPPRGHYTKENHHALQQLGKCTVLWDLGLEKKLITRPDQLVTHLLSRIGGRKELILLLHDGSVDKNDRTLTVEALPILIHRLSSMGCTFVDPGSKEGQAYLSRYASNNQCYRY